MAAVFNLKRIPLLRQIVETPQILPIRKFLFDVHLWCGVAIGLYMIMQSITGVSLVFRDELDQALNQPPPLEVNGPRLGFSQMVENVENESPGYKVTGIINNLKADQPVRIYASGKGNKRISRIVDQYSGKVLGPIPENRVLNFLQDLHFNMLLDRTGRMVNGVMGGLLILMSISGIVLWWKGIRIWTRGLVFSWKSHLRKLNWDAHHAVGFWMLPLLINWGLSAIYFGYRTQFEDVVRAVMPVAKEAPPTVLHDRSGQRNPSLDEMVLIATNAAPHLDVARISLPGMGKKRTDRTLQVWLTEADSVRKDLATEVDIDVRTGEILSVSTPEQRPAGDLFMAWITRLHFGNFVGVYSKVLWCVIGLSPAVLSLTGLYLWWHRITRKNIKTWIRRKRLFIFDTNLSKELSFIAKSFLEVTMTGHSAHPPMRSMHISIEQRIHATPEQVFAALTTGVALWWGAGHLERENLAKDLYMEARLGGRFYESWELPRSDDDGSLLGTVIQIRRPEVLKIAGYFGLEELNAHGVVSFMLRQDRTHKNTVLHMTHDAFGALDDQMQHKMNNTWKELMSALKELVEKRQTRGLRNDPALDDD